MLAFSIHRRAWSFALLKNVTEMVLAVPGERLAHETLYCGVKSGREVDKVDECGLQLAKSKTVSCPGLSAAIANIELSVQNVVCAGDHMTVFGRVRRYAVNRHNAERNLLSIGPDHDGYTLLVSKGLHRIGVVSNRQERQ
jgi:flavin reductase (DIM6/NTAB) family NADH-FMN oxidoreductase RutF